MENLKTRVENEAESKEAQDLFLELGFKKGVVGRGCYPMDIVAVICPRFSREPYSSSATRLDHDGHKDYKKLTIQELRDMVVLKRNDVGDANFINKVTGIRYFISSVGEIYFWGGNWEKCHTSIRIESLKPIKEDVMKEFLNPEQNYSLVQCCVGKTPIPESWIEVPEGADIYGRNKLCGVTEFYKNDGKHDLLKIGKDGVWVRSKYHVGNIIDYWVREKESIIDKLVVDEVKNGVDATLAERQAQYGEFSDVAELTSDLMGDLLKDDMSFVQREALHMICSKLSRLRHGDVNKIDTWLDIAGYATLVVRDLEKRGK